MAGGYPINPVKIYEANNEVTKLLSVYVTLSVANNQQIVAGVSGYKVRVMGWILQGNGGNPAFNLKDGSGGATLCLLTLVTGAAGANDKLPITDSGYFETSTGNGLFVDIATVGCLATIFYTLYKP